MPAAAAVRRGDVPGRSRPGPTGGTPRSVRSCRPPPDLGHQRGPRTASGRSPRPQAPLAPAVRGRKTHPESRSPRRDEKRTPNPLWCPCRRQLDQRSHPCAAFSRITPSPIARSEPARPAHPGAPLVAGRPSPDAAPFPGLAGTGSFPAAAWNAIIARNKLSLTLWTVRRAPGNPPRQHARGPAGGHVNDVRPGRNGMPSIQLPRLYTNGDNCEAD